MIKEFRGQYWFLSNFYPCDVEFEGKVYPSVEHAFQAAKTLDEKQREMIRNAKTPADAKKLGRKVTLRDDWEEIKVDIMLSLVRQKFTKHIDLRDRLLETGNEYIQEGNTWGDTFWGVDLRTGRGRNVLGKILMKVREELKQK